MALEQGIDTQVQDKMDAYRSNPQQLMKMYQTNKQLVDLLALQKLKSEKEAAARDIKLQMEQAPGTIKQQREQELMQMTKDELAKQTQGVLQQKQRKQQSNLQRIAKGKSGLGALAQNRPASVQTQTPKSMLAGGGIVAFQEGGSAFGDSAAGLKGYTTLGEREGAGSKVKEYLADYGITNFDEWQRTPQDEKDRILSAVKAKAAIGRTAGFTNSQLAELNDFLLDPLKVIANLGIAASNTSVGSGLGLSDPRNLNVPYQYNTNRDKIQQQIAENLVAPDSMLLPKGPAQTIQKDPDAVPVLNSSSPTNVTNSQAKLLAKILSYPDATPVTPTDSSGGIGGIDMETGIAALNVPPSDNNKMANTAVDTSMTDVNSQMAGINAISGGNMGGAEDALKRGVGIGEDVLGRGDKAAKYAGLEADLAAFDEATYDPEEDRRRQLQAFLIGSAGKTSVGTTLAGGAAAALNEESRQKINSRKRMIDRINLSKDAMTSDTDLGKSALSLGNQMFADYNANQRTAMSAAATLGASKLRATVDMAKLDFERDREENTKEYRLKELEIREIEADAKIATNNEISATRRNNAILSATAKSQELSLKIDQEAAARYGLEDAQESLDLARVGGDEEAIRRATEAFNMANAEATAWAETYKDSIGITDRLSSLEALYYELNGIDNMPGINVDDIKKIEPKR